MLGNKISFAYIQAVLTTICSNSEEVLQKTDKGTKSQNGNEGRSHGRREGERRKGKGREERGKEEVNLNSVMAHKKNNIILLSGIR